jgi:hypothetical protein
MVNKQDGNHTPSPPSGGLTFETYKAGVQRRKRKRVGKKVVRDEKVGDNWDHDRKKFVKLQQIVDKENPENRRYYKHVEDPDTGEVIRHVDEPLGDHQGYGSAKKKTKP